MIAAKLCCTAQKGPRETLTPLLIILLLIISTRSRGILFFREIAFTTMIVGDQVYKPPCTNFTFDEEGLSTVGKGSEVGLLCTRFHGGRDGICERMISFVEWIGATWGPTVQSRIRSTLGLPSGYAECVRGPRA
jgi:hypothetical protein